MSLFVVAWAVWYAARMWDVPPEFANTPTYASHAQDAAAATPPAAPTAPLPVDK
jgi:hypothetical protein